MLVRSTSTAAIRCVDLQEFDVLTAEYKERLTTQVFERDKEIFMFVHNRPSTIDYIFYGTDGHTYLVELCYSIGNHPIGLLSPGILKK